MLPAHKSQGLLPLSCHFPLNLSRWISIPSQINPHQPSPLTRNDLLDSLDHLLINSTTLQHIKQVHSHVITTGSSNSAYLAARIISLYSRFCRISDSQKVFDSSLSGCLSNLLFWNSIIRANVSNECYVNALKLFAKMRELGVSGDGFTFPLILRACAHMGSFGLCRILHGHVLEMGFGSHVHVGNELVGMYTKLGQMEDARNVLDRMVVRSHISWNMMVSGYALHCDCNGALELFRRMEAEGLEPNVVTWVSLMSCHARAGWNEETLELYDLMRKRGVGVNAEALAVVLSGCADFGAFDKGKVVHGCVVKGGFERYLFVKNALICLYGKCGNINGARKLFLEMENKNIVSWNALITSYVDAGMCDEALEVFSQLQKSESCPMLRPNIVSWSAVISGLASDGRGEESLGLFRQMQLAKVMATAITISSVLAVCAELAAVNLGREIHGHVIRALMDSNILVENGLVNMYLKCGCLKEGHLIFDNIKRKDLISWNSMITGYGTHGLAMEAVVAFDKMIKSGFEPDAITFVAVLSACSHAGLVSEGRRLFELMRREYQIEPLMEHYACMVDLLGRAGLLQEATNIVENMPMEPNICVWGALLNACRMHKNTEVVTETASYILGHNLKLAGSYMLLSNIYAADGRWEDSAMVRASARTKGLKKSPGHSWVEVKNKVHVFSAGNDVENGVEGVCGILEAWVAQMESGSCILDDSVILQNVDEINRTSTGIYTMLSS